MSDDTKMLKIADLLQEASDLIPDYVYSQERVRDELKKNSEDLKQQILDQEIIIQDLKKELDKQQQIIHDLKQPKPKTNSTEKGKKTWWSYK
jgi:hypothetical protein